MKKFETAEKIRQLTHLTYDEIASKLDLGVGYVQYVARWYGIKVAPKPRPKMSNEIRAARALAKQQAEEAIAYRQGALTVEQARQMQRLDKQGKKSA
jgi:hypothetical protein